MEAQLKAARDNAIQQTVINTIVIGLNVICYVWATNTTCVYDGKPLIKPYNMILILFIFLMFIAFFKFIEIYVAYRDHKRIATNDEIGHCEIYLHGIASFWNYLSFFVNIAVLRYY